jgi:hypothetical protein
MTMRPMAATRLLGVLLVGAAVGPTAQTVPDPPINVVRLPAGGIQPQIAVDGGGGVHVVYFAGEPANGDLFYARLSNGAFSAPIRVNSVAGSAIATGTVRGARLAVGRNGRVHVAWNGSSRASSKTGGMPMLYTRMSNAGTAFEPQRNVVQFTSGVDGGGALVADRRGNVYVAWHAGPPDSKGEGDRRVWLRISGDDGRTFGPERAISNVETGACGCCGMDGLADDRGNLYFLYRSARELMNRDSYLLASTDAGRTFRSLLMQPWGVGACPMSTYDLIGRDGVVLAAWETGGQVQFARVTDVRSPVTMVTPPGASKLRRHPSLAINARGGVLMSWSEGTGWQKGGAVAWQIFDPAGKPTSQSGRAEGVPVWGLTAAFPRADNGFTIVY